ncbi:TPA: hypothetical protein HA316_04635 [Candidatus Micrarchaeota archaeon]|nr:hypothetical protein [Candidatus Micrarchaeota archaeon]
MVFLTAHIYAILVSNASYNGTIYLFIPANNGTSISIQTPDSNVQAIYTNKSTVQLPATSAGIWRIRVNGQTYYSYVAAPAASSPPSAELEAFVPYVFYALAVVIALWLALFLQSLAEQPAFAKKISKNGTAIRFKNSGETLERLTLTDGKNVFRRKKVMPFETIEIRHAALSQTPAKLTFMKEGKKIELESEVRMQS